MFASKTRLPYTEHFNHRPGLAMLIKVLVLATLAAILVSLATGMLFLIKDKGRTERTAKALTVRIGLSVVLFGLLMLGILTGYIKPHGIYPAGQPATHPQGQPAG